MKVSATTGARQEASTQIYGGPPGWSRAPRTAELYRARGLDVVAVPITEFDKLEGCVTCLRVR